METKTFETLFSNIHRDSLCEYLKAALAELSGVKERAELRWAIGFYDELDPNQQNVLKVKLWRLDAARVHIICAIEYLNPELGAKIKEDESEPDVRFCPVCDMLTKKKEG